MRNTDYVICIATKRGRAWSYLKENNSWTQTAPTGVVRRMTAEQLLSHLLPPLAKDQPHLNVTVAPKAAHASAANPNAAIAAEVVGQARRLPSIAHHGRRRARPTKI